MESEGSRETGIHRRDKIQGEKDREITRGAERD
jgi:hypothetical protein